MARRWRQLDDYIATSFALPLSIRATQRFARTNADEWRSRLAKSIFWLYTILVDEEVQKKVAAVHALSRERGIQARPLWQPLHQSPAYKTANLIMYGRGIFEPDGLSCLASTGLTADEQQSR